MAKTVVWFSIRISKVNDDDDDDDSNQEDETTHYQHNYILD